VQPRCLRERLERALGKRPVVVLLGPRRVGKSALVRRIARRRGMGYRDLADPETRKAAKGGAERFLEGLRLPAALDGVEGIPALFAALGRRLQTLPSGSFLLAATGEPRGLGRLVASAPDRVEVLALDPLTQAEQSGACFDLFKALEAPPTGRPPESWERAFVTGGLPELKELLRRDRDAWWESYLATPDGRARTAEAARERPLLSLLAEEGPALLNKSAWAKRLDRSLDWIHSTLERLEARGWVRRLPAFRSPELGKLAQQPRLLLFDSGLVAHLAGTRYAGERERAFRTFALLELLRHANFAGFAPYHLRTYKGRTVDLVLERPDGRLLAFRIRATPNPSPADLGDLPWLRERLGGRLAAGYLVHTGEEARELEGFRAVPLRVLWP